MLNFSGERIRNEEFPKGGVRYEILAICFLRTKKGNKSKNIVSKQAYGCRKPQDIVVDLFCYRSNLKQA